MYVFFYHLSCLSSRLSLLRVLSVYHNMGLFLFLELDLKRRPTHFFYWY